MFSFIDHGWLNIGSLILGLIAWYLPASSILNYKKGTLPHPAMSVVSLVACATALWFQVGYNNHLVQIQDWTALADLTFTMYWVAGILLIVTVLLNMVSIHLYKNIRIAQ